MTPPFGRCVWCGGGRFNKEHVIGKQIAKAMNLPYPIVAHWGTWTGSPKQTLSVVLKRRVCASCNGGWMRRMDNDMIAIARTAVAAASEMTLDANAQGVLARWATKVALLLELYLHDRALVEADRGTYYVPTDNFGALFRNRHPAPSTQVWIGTVDPKGGMPPFSTGGGSLFRPGVTPEGRVVTDEVGFHAVFSLRSLLFRVVGWDERVVPTPIRISGSLPPLPQIWPVEQPTVDWPQPATWKPHQLVHLTAEPVPFAAPEVKRPANPVVPPPDARE